jgi:hypothetical protein
VDKSYGLKGAFLKDYLFAQTSLANRLKYTRLVTASPHREDWIPLLNEAINYVGTGASSAVLTVYDGPAANDQVRAVIDASAAGRWPFHGAWFKDGCYVVQSGGDSKSTVIAGD